MARNAADNTAPTAKELSPAQQEWQQRKQQAKANAVPLGQMPGIENLYPGTSSVRPPMANMMPPMGAPTTATPPPINGMPGFGATPNQGFGMVQNQGMFGNNNQPNGFNNNPNGFGSNTMPPDGTNPAMVQQMQQQQLQQQMWLQ